MSPLDATTRQPWNGARDGVHMFRTWVDPTSQPPVVGVAGEVDLTTCGALRQAIDEALDGGSRQLVLDFSHLAFMGSTGIRELVVALRGLDHLEIRHAAPAVRKVIEMTGFDSRLELT